MVLIIRYLMRWWRSRQAKTTAVSTRPEPTRARAAGSTAAARGSLALLVHQVRYDILTSLRNPRARFFTFFFPVLLLVVFSSVFGHGTTTVDGVTVKLARYYVPGILAASIVVATYANLVVLITTLRETGVLKRRRATPVRPAVLIVAQALATLVVAMIMGTILLVLAKAAYGVGLAPGALLATASRRSSGR